MRTLRGELTTDMKNYVDQGETSIYIQRKKTDRRNRHIEREKKKLGGQTDADEQFTQTRKLSWRELFFFGAVDQ